MDDKTLIEALQNLSTRLARLESLEFGVANSVPTCLIENLPPFGIQGRLIFLTNGNIKKLIHDDGTGWHYVSGGGLVV